MADLKSLWKAILDTPVGDPGGLHWRGDELWCGPVRRGTVWRMTVMSDTFGSVLGGEKNDYWDSMAEARAALETAVQEQIRKWVEESSNDHQRTASSS